MLLMASVELPKPRSFLLWTAGAAILCAAAACGEAVPGDTDEGDPPATSPVTTPTQPADVEPTSEPTNPASAPSPTDEPSLPDAGGSGPGPEPELERCLPPEGISGSPGTLVEVMHFINALPRPLSIPCFLQALDRPLAMTTTNSFVSAQPAVGNANPRIFLKVGELYISVVPAGTGRDLVEFGELTSNLRSYKAELLFPLEGPLEPEMFYEHIMRTTSSVCAFCHSAEVWEEHDTLGFTIESDAYRPNPNYDVPLDEVRLEHEQCDPELEPERCAMFSALFDHGPVEYHAFPEEMRIFF